MLHKAWNNKGEVPYCFPRLFIKFQGHTGQNITDLTQIGRFRTIGQSQLSNPSDLPCYFSYRTFFVLWHCIHHFTCRLIFCYKCLNKINGIRTQWFQDFSIYYMRSLLINYCDMTFYDRKEAITEQHMDDIYDRFGNMKKKKKHTWNEIWKFLCQRALKGN